jgi:hypothetical protein
LLGVGGVGRLEWALLAMVIGSWELLWRVLAVEMVLGWGVWMPGRGYRHEAITI